MAQNSELNTIEQIVIFTGFKWTRYFENNICNKYLNKLKNIIGSSNVEILSRVKEKQSALDKMKVRHFVSANQISDFVGYMIIPDTVADV